MLILQIEADGECLEGMSNDRGRLTLRVPRSKSEWGLRMLQRAAENPFAPTIYVQDFSDRC